MDTALIGKRLKALRDERGVDQDAVASMLGFGSRQIVSNIETGERKIKPSELVALVEHFGVDLEYFTDPYRLVGEGKFSWRQNGLSGCELKVYEATAGSWLAMYRHEAPRVGEAPMLKRPKLPLTRFSSFEDASLAGERVSEELQLGDVPASQLAQALEQEFGILVLMVDAIEGISGAACRLPELDAVLVNRHEILGRRNFDLAHELFHIMTWEEMPPDYIEEAVAYDGKGRRSRVEQLADNFASALLMPRRILERFGDWSKLGASELTSRLNDIADKLLVTAQALKWRLLSLGKLSRALIGEIADDLLRNNGRSRCDEIVPPPFSRSFLSVIGKAVDAGYVSRRRVSAQLGLEISELSLVFDQHNLPVPEGF